MNGVFPAYLTALAVVLTYYFEPVHKHAKPALMWTLDGCWEGLLHLWCMAMRHAADPRYDYTPRHL